MPAAADSSARLPVALFGLGAIGRMHLERAGRSPDVAVVAVCDPSPAAEQVCAQMGMPWAPEPASLLARHDLRAAIVATPTEHHASVGLACIARGLPVLMEKPIAGTLADAERLCAGAEAAGVPLLVGHHRRHNPLLRQAQALLREGLLGVPVAAQVMACWLKPDDYFQAAWRREPGGGPVLINLIHDIDALRWLLEPTAGPVVEVQAMAGRGRRGFAVEDTAAVLLRFAGGALATLLTTDTAAAPWNWDLDAGEAAHYARHGADSTFLSGTEGALALPSLTQWRYRGARGWHQTLTQTRTPVHMADPYLEQLRHLRAVAAGREAPVCSGRDALTTLRTTQAVLEAARLAAPVRLA